MKRLLLVANSNRPEAIPNMNKLCKWLKGKAEVLDCVTDSDSYLGGYEANYLITFGGDGTILNTARRLKDKQIPVLGVNLGHLGYLSEISSEQMLEGITKLLQDKVDISKRMMLECLVTKKGKQEATYQGLNDVFIASLERIMELEVSLSGKPLTSFRADGVIIATPTGSTAHSLSAGGPILSPDLRAMVLTPVCAHELANRPLVVSDQEYFSLKITAKSGSARLTIDGQQHLCLEHDTLLEIKPAKNIFYLVQMPDIGRFDILRQKLGWGGRNR